MKTAKRNLNNVEMSIKDHIWLLCRKAVMCGSCTYYYIKDKKCVTNINMLFFFYCKLLISSCDRYDIKMTAIVVCSS